jgi:sigma-B regulation protein RsbU (phosphoserine phosphatase)
MTMAGRDDFELAPCGYLELGPDGRILAVNPKFLALVGLPHDDIVGTMSLVDFLGVGDRMYHETHYQPMLQMQGEAHEIAFDLKRSDGATVPVLLSSNVTPGVDGSPVIRTIVFEARERRTYEEELLTARRAAEAAETRALTLGRTLQETFVPPAPPNVVGIDIAGVYRPAGDGSEVGGDFYDVFQIREGDWLVALGDVAGKGVDAAAVTTFVQHAIRAVAIPSGSTAEMLTGLNAALLGASYDRFCTVVLMRLQQHDGRWTASVSCGGHDLPLLRDSSGTVRELGEWGSLLGVADAPQLSEEQVELHEGDTVLLFTDGVTEARHGLDMYGQERLRALLATAGSTSQELVTELLDDVMAFQGADARDDIALVAITVSPQG